MSEIPSDKSKLVEDPAVAETMARASDLDRTHARTLRIGSTLAVAAFEKSRRDGSVYANPHDFIPEEMDGIVPRAPDRDLASAILTGDRLDLLSEEGPAEVEKRYQGAAELADRNANEKEDAALHDIPVEEGTSDTYQIPVIYK